MTKLTDLQLILLSTASQRDDGNLLPPPDSVGERSPEIDKALTSLMRRGLAAELDVSDNSGPMPKARDHLLSVRITAKGREAIGLTEQHDDDADLPVAAAPVADPKKETKASKVIVMLRRETGATLDELVAATGWLPHTTRAALTGLRKKGHTLTSGKQDGVRRYRIHTAAATEATA